MSRPPINPDKSLAGIVLDPHTLERVVPESQRPDGSIRKQLKIRQGFTPQEDVRRFRSTLQQQMDSRALPKDHIIGWVPPSSAETNTKPMTKSAKKNAKRKEKRAEKKQQDEAVPEDWEEDEETQDNGNVKGGETKSTSSSTSKSDKLKSGGADGLADKLEKLKVQDVQDP